MIKSIFLVIACLLPSTLVLAQGRADLEMRRRQLLKEIQETRTELAETRKEKKATTSDFNAIQQKIEKREEIIKSLQIEIDISESSIVSTSKQIERLQLNLEAIKKEYAATLRKTFRQKINHNATLFLFSADNFNQGLRRFRYVKEYDLFRKRQARKIEDTKKELSLNIKQLEQKKVEKSRLVTQNEEQNVLLNQDLVEKERILKELKQDEHRLKLELSEQQVAHEQLNTAIETMIRTEMEARRKDARKREALEKLKEEHALKEEARKTKGNKNKNLALPNTTKERKPINLNDESPESYVISESFKKNKGKLPPPVAGTIVRYFGRQAHPTIKELEITNNGIDIKTEGNTLVKAVFKGRVVGTQFIPGTNNMIIIQHGAYYTVYSNLSDIRVKRNDLVDIRQVLGKAAISTSTNQSEVHFEVWLDKDRLNPMAWIQK